MAYLGHGLTLEILEYCNQTHIQSQLYTSETKNDIYTYKIIYNQNLKFYLKNFTEYDFLRDN